MPANLRPIEQVVVRELTTGTSVNAVATSLRKRPGTIRRIAEMAELAQDLELDRDRHRSTDADGMRPIERTIARLRGQGQTIGEVASRLRRSGDYVRRVESYTQLKRDRNS